ncbi:MAG TPA: hypothetical protein VMT99_04105 [Candidatus Paceibacterota bacterium]|nr:hypothetical protein [Candidatus Paceibacterota bacterium]
MATLLRANILSHSFRKHFRFLTPIWERAAVLRFADMTVTIDKPVVLPISGTKTSRIVLRAVDAWKVVTKRQTLILIYGTVEIGCEVVALVDLKTGCGPILIGIKAKQRPSTEGLVLIE